MTTLPITKSAGKHDKLSDGAVNVRKSGGKPRVLMLVDVPNWAFDHSAKQLAARLAGRFDFDIRYVSDQPELDGAAYDAAYVFFWGETYHRRLGIPPEKLIKEVSSHRWQFDPAYGQHDPKGLVRNYLRDAEVVICTSQRLHQLIAPCHPQVRFTPNGYDPTLFFRTRERTGKMVAGWAGNSKDTVKGIEDVLKPACEGRFTLRTAGGGLAHGEMNSFYNELDVFLIGSQHEGEPLTLIEAMAAGCFPVCTDVGIVRELIQDRKNGLIVRERSVEAFREALSWCTANIDYVRSAGTTNARVMPAERSWDRMADAFGTAFDETIAAGRRLKFRNDDISADTDLPAFRAFCRLFWKYQQRQTHGVTLRGRTTAAYETAGEPAEYEGQENISRVPNQRIRELSEPWRMEDRADVINFLNGSPDEIALHGLYHVDHSVMSVEDLRKDLTEGLNQLAELFPAKPVRYFIPPFNRISDNLRRVCSELGLYLLDATGVHLEAELQNIAFRPGVWHRYHHHRFYPTTRCRYYPLNLQLLEAAFQRNQCGSRIIREATAAGA